MSVFKRTNHIPAGLETGSASHGLLWWGNSLMLAGLLMTLLSVLMSYTWADQLSLLLQGLSHISMLLWATLIKFGFLMRLVALNQRRFGGRPSCV